MNWSEIDWDMILEATIDTLLMTGWSLLFTILLGLPLGVYLFLSSEKQLLENKPVYQVLSLIVNIFRSVPFIILLVVLIPFTRFVVGSALGVAGAVVPLVVCAVPFFARLVENALRELDPGISEAAKSMGATTLQTVRMSLLPEAWTGILAAITVTAISLIGYSAMSGVIGGGGLGDIAIRFGYQRYQMDVMIVTVVILVLLVQGVQMLGDHFVNKLSRK
ncbi:methionine ABC transporter permease [Taylorella equigenitalis]|uniref:Methionine ABC transporter permease protein n=3 Tax=Taylorella equigenitalis TaxID=29575 RepID=A0A654KI05_TAYEM|nr:methionine ABC transporter permease [Taylorella equigenitalis]ADU91516.1 Methionine ABC transporter permease protein [Taylorella equigenitalis MCE9]AFN36599.1 ABC transport system, permease [Taylorella equigenitalis ATCC 35865]ASY31162.1 metal ABC transporter permease [Taylorella equigenitalis]ASY38463.1 ABC transporter permease [Taylorella equigenitalis]ASY39999.1 metal ABC transporter permease [Taylorella equigenitalis]